jgi:four helix bundle protein
MATIQQFEDLICWQRARELTNQIYKTCRAGAISKDHGLCDQIQRASVSVMSNIAEGFERGTKQEFLNYLYIAKGSCGEVRAQLYVMLDSGYLNTETFKYLNGLAVECSRLLSSFIQKVKLSTHAGLQYKAEKTERQKAADEIMRQVREITERARQKREAEAEARAKAEAEI